MERDEVMSVLTPEGTDIDQAIDHILEKYPDEDMGRDEINATYEQGEHEKLEKGYVRGSGMGLPYPLGLCLQFYLSILDDSSVTMVSEVLTKLRLDKPVSRALYLARTKELTDWVKRRGPKFDKEWRKLIDLSSLVGFNLKGQDERQQRTTVFEWCGGEIIREKMTDIKVVAGIREIILTGDNAIKKFLTLEEFIANPDLWATKGSGKGTRAVLIDTQEGREVMSTSNKSAVALSMGVGEIIARLEQRKSEVFSISNKVEVAGKGRVIISPGWEFNLLMAYVLRYLEPALKRKRSDSPLWLYPSGIHELWVRVAASIKKGHCMYPQDASRFDQTLSTDEFDALLDGIEDWIKRIRVIGQRTQLLRVWTMVRVRWRTARVSLPGGGTIRWEHGMPSGIRLTALGDTIVSLGRTLAIIKQRKLSVLYVYGMGDDILISGSSNAYVYDVFKDTNDMGVTVNAAKNFASKVHAEFLRVGVDEDNVCGYPARHIVKHLFVEPGSAMPRLRDVSDMRAFVTSAVMFINRQCSEEKVLKHVEDTLQREAGGWTRDWLHTPITQGGVGFLPATEAPTWPKQLQKFERYEVKGYGTFGQIVSNTVACGVDEEKVKRELASRVVRGLPGNTTYGQVEVFFGQKIVPVSDIYSGVKNTLIKNAIFAKIIKDYRMDDEKVGVVMQDLVVDKLIEDGDWGRIEEYAAKEVKREVKAYAARWERKLFILWVRGKLPKPGARVRGWSDNAISNLCERVIGVRDNYIVRKRRVSYSDFLCATFAVECALNDHCMSTIVKLGY